MGRRKDLNAKLDTDFPIRKGSCLPNFKGYAGSESRKQLRKQARLMKKEKKRAYFCKSKKFETAEIKSQSNSNKPVHAEIKTKIIINDDKKQQLQLQQDKIKADENLKKKQAKNRKRVLMKDNEYEEKNIKKLEKRLKMNKRKSKTLPKIFVADGLDYILEACNSDLISRTKDVDLDECESNFGEDLALATGQETIQKDSVNSDIVIDLKSKSEECQKSDSKIGIESELESEAESVDNLDEGAESFDSEREDELNDNSEVQSDDDDEDEIQEDFKEDIYGQLINSDGKVINTKRYVAPHLRNDDDNGDLSFQRLNKRLKRLINKLDESKMAATVNEIEKLYMNHSRNNMNSILIKLLLVAIVKIKPIQERIVQEYCMLVAILHANIGPEVGARIVEVLAKKFNELREQGSNYGEGNQCDNLLLILIHLYTFKVIHSMLVYDILDILINSFEEKSIELILLILESAGFSLRKDDPIRLKNVIIKIQSQAKDNTAKFQNAKRVQCMLDILMAIRDNNMHKIKNYDVTHRDHLRKLIKTFIRKGNSITELNITMKDLMDVDTKGRWWIVGSSWKDKSDDSNITAANSSSASVGQEVVSEKILDLALKLHINTDIRKNIFSIIMTAEDYIDAFERLLKLSLKNAQERESIHVALECCLQEKKYNPYYGYLLQRFCNHERKYQMMVQFSLWDKFKELSTASNLQISNLSQISVHLILTNALAISLFKVLEFSEINNPTVRFLRQSLIKILLHESQKEMEEVFTRVAASPQLRMFREGLKLFMKHFLLKRANKLPLDVTATLESRIQTAEMALQSSDVITRL